MDDLSSLVEGIISHLGRAFFFSGFMPILILIVVNQHLIFAPNYAGTEEIWNIFPELTQPFLGLVSAEWLTAIVAALLLTLVMLPLNAFVIRFFEGMLPGMKAVLYPFYSQKVRQHRARYAEIAAKRAERQAQLSPEGAVDEEADEAIQEALDVLHYQKEQKDPIQLLPFERRRLTPTDFGNAWAVMEEIPLSRYGIDPMVFWPYLRTILSDASPQLLEQIDNQKLLVDTAINLALMMGILCIEGLAFGALHLEGAFFLAALIEGFLSPSAAPYWTKALVAVLSTGLLMFYFVGLGYPQGE